MPAGKWAATFSMADALSMADVPQRVSTDILHSAPSVILHRNSSRRESDCVVWGGGPWGGGSGKETKCGDYMCEWEGEKMVVWSHQSRACPLHNSAPLAAAPIVSVLVESYHKLYILKYT